MDIKDFGKKPLIGVLLLTSLLCIGCTQPDTAQRVLSNQGYKNIQMQGYGFFSCSKDDWYRDKFTATSPTGQNVRGVVCSGLFFKESTIRFD